VILRSAIPAGENGGIVEINLIADARSIKEFDLEI
jgi:hypothetical protein